MLHETRTPYCENIDSGSISDYLINRDLASQWSLQVRLTLWQVYLVRIGAAHENAQANQSGDRPHGRLGYIHS